MATAGCGAVAPHHAKHHKFFVVRKMNGKKSVSEKKSVEGLLNGSNMEQGNGWDSLIGRMHFCDSNNGGVKNNSGTVKQQILVYLLENCEKQNTRLDIAKNICKPACVVSRAGKKIIQRGLAYKKRIYTAATDRFRDAYILTDDGATMAMEIKATEGVAT